MSNLDNLCNLFALPLHISLIVGICYIYVLYMLAIKKKNMY